MSEEIKPACEIMVIEFGSQKCVELVSGEMPEIGTMLYPLPATHRIVPVELLERAIEECHCWMGESAVAAALQVIIDKEPT